MGVLGLILLPPAYGYSLYRLWDFLEAFDVVKSLTAFGLFYFGQMCGVVVLLHLQIQSQGGSLHTAQTPAVSKEEEAEEKKRLKKQGCILQVIFVVIVLIAIKIANS
jgi:hypothetical protein